VRAFALATPFPWVMAFPAELLAGMEGPGARGWIGSAVTGFLVLLGWGALLLPLTCCFWRLGVRRYRRWGPDGSLPAHPAGASGGPMAAELEYPLNFLIELLSVGGQPGRQPVCAGALLHTRPQPGRMELGGALVVLGIYTLLDGVTSTLLQPNLSTIVKHVQNGTSISCCSNRSTASSGCRPARSPPGGCRGLLAGAWSLIVVAPGRAGAAPPPSPTCWGCQPVAAASALILYSLWFVLAATSIWFVKVWNATEVLRSTLVAGRFPDQRLPRRDCASCSPSCCRWLSSPPCPPRRSWVWATLPWMLASLGVAALALLASRLFWRYALRFYTSASS
jgi:ABC-2 type transport system permease protein